MKINIRKKLKNVKPFITGVLVTIVVYFSFFDPKDKVDLSKDLGEKLVNLSNYHNELDTLDKYYQKMEEDINDFMDNVYVPYIINYVLKGELDSFKKGKRSLYGLIQKLAENDSKENKKEVLKDMKQFQEAVLENAKEKRKYMLPKTKLLKEKIISYIKKEFESALQMNSEITEYLKSIGAIKKTSEEVSPNLYKYINAIKYISKKFNISKEKEVKYLKLKMMDPKSDSAKEKKIISYAEKEFEELIKDIDELIKDIESDNAEKK